MITGERGRPGRRAEGEMNLDSRKADSTAIAEEPRFAVSIESADRTLSARLIGTADLDVKSTLDEFLERLHQTALAGSVAEVVMDFRELKFMNSSCLKGLVAWICTLQELPPPRRYRVVLVSSPEMRWQRRSLRALWSLATDLVTIRS
jgi:hypothetical protein